MLAVLGVRYHPYAIAGVPERGIEVVAVLALDDVYDVVHVQLHRIQGGGVLRQRGVSDRSLNLVFQVGEDTRVGAGRPRCQKVSNVGHARRRYLVGERYVVRGAWVAVRDRLDGDHHLAILGDKVLTGRRCKGVTQTTVG